MKGTAQVAEKSPQVKPMFLSVHLRVLWVFCGSNLLSRILVNGDQRPFAGRAATIEYREKPGPFLRLTRRNNMRDKTILVGGILLSALLTAVGCSCAT